MNKQVWLAFRVGVDNTQPITLKEGRNVLGRCLGSDVIGCKSNWVSRKHCEINIIDGLAFVKDLKALNGTYIGINRIDIERLVEVKNGDIISLGKPYLNEEQVRGDITHYAYKLHAVQDFHKPDAPVKRRSTAGDCNDAKRRKESTSPVRIQESLSVVSTTLIPEVIDLTDEEERKSSNISVIASTEESGKSEKESNLNPESKISDEKKCVPEAKNKCPILSDIEYNAIEENLRNIVCEANNESTGGNNIGSLNLAEQTHKKDDDMELGEDSFSQKGCAFAEVDEDDIRYSQLFSDDIVDVDNITNLKEDKNFLDCSIIIKEEVDDLHEQEINLFESHFSQYSQDGNFDLKDAEETGSNIDKPLSNLEVPHEKEKKCEDIESATKIQIASSPSTAKSNSVCNSNAVSLESVASTSGTEVCSKEQSINIVSKKSSICDIVPSSLSNDDIIPDALSMSNLKEFAGSNLVKSTLHSKPIYKIRETKTKKQLRKQEPSVTRDAHKKKLHEQIKHERRQKLKDLALKKNDSVDDTTVKKNDRTNKENNEKQVKENNLNDNTDVSKDVKVAKITERNRSSILLEGLMIEPQTKKRGRPKKSTSGGISESSSTVTENKVIARKDANKTKKKVSFNLKPQIRIFECDGILNKLVTGALSKIKDKPPQIVANKPKSDIGIEQLFFHIVHWNASWISECKLIKGDPPLCYPDSVVKNKDMFVSHADYKRWLNPMLLYEIWANIIKTTDDTDCNKSARLFNCYVIASELSRNDKRLLTLKCSLPVKRNQIPTLVDPMDHLLIKIVKGTNIDGTTPRVQDSGNKILLLFGVVSSLVKVINIRDVKDPVARSCLAREQASQNKSAEVCAFFDVVIYNSPQRKIVDSCAIKIRPTYNMRTEVKQFEALLALQCSPLLDLILDPDKNNKIILPQGPSEKIVTSLQLNEEQQNAALNISKTLSSDKPSISLIHGPPGTGKTRLIVALVEQLLRKFKDPKSGKKQMMMICAQSNNAIDEICSRLLDRRRHLTGNDRFRLTRYGNRDKINSKLNDILTTTIAQKQVEKLNLDEVFSTELSVMKAQETMIAASLENCTRHSLNEYRRNYSYVQNRRSILEQIVNKTAKEDVRKREVDRLVSDEELKVLHHCDIIATTLGSCVTSRIRRALSDGFGGGRELAVCIIDEATQATELDTLLPLLYGIKKFVLIGDPQQLFPVVLSETSKNNGLHHSLFSRLHKVWSNNNYADQNMITPVYTLKTQYRMHPEIVKFPSLEFYNNSLVTPHYLSVNRYFKPYAVITHDFPQDPDSAESNTKEAELLIDFVDRILSQPVFDRLSIGLIVPYQKQKGIIAGFIHDKKWKRIVKVNTIDSYQGQEKDIIIMSTVRTTGVGFLSDYQRTNVAITRAKRGCYILANFSSLQTEPLWKRLLIDAQKRNFHLPLKSSKSGSTIIRFIVDENKRSYC